MMNKLSLKKLYEKVKKIKNIEYFILILAIAIVISMFGNIFTGKDDTPGSSNQDEVSNVTAKEDPIDYSKEQRLKQVLSTIKGAGSVEVMISYKSGKEIVPAMNSIESSTETEETDSSGGVRRIVQSDINSQPVSMSTSAGTEALITKEVEPEIIGVIVVAEGAEALNVRMELQNAVQTLLGISANQVEVFAMDIKEER